MPPEGLLAIWIFPPFWGCFYFLLACAAGVCFYNPCLFVGCCSSLLALVVNRLFPRPFVLFVRVVVFLYLAIALSPRLVTAWVLCSLPRPNHGWTNLLEDAC